MPSGLLEAVGTLNSRMRPEDAVDGACDAPVRALAELAGETAASSRIDATVTPNDHVRLIERPPSTARRYRFLVTTRDGPIRLARTRHFFPDERLSQARSSG
jgi:hypothetical protein